MAANLHIWSYVSKWVQQDWYFRYTYFFSLLLHAVTPTLLLFWIPSMLNIWLASRLNIGKYARHRTPSVSWKAATKHHICLLGNNLEPHAGLQPKSNDFTVFMWLPWWRVAGLTQRRQCFAKLFVPFPVVLLACWTAVPNKAATAFLHLGNLYLVTVLAFPHAKSSIELVKGMLWHYRRASNTFNGSRLTTCKLHVIVLKDVVAEAAGMHEHVLHSAIQRNHTPAKIRPVAFRHPEESLTVSNCITCSSKLELIWGCRVIRKSLNVSSPYQYIYIYIYTYTYCNILNFNSTHMKLIWHYPWCITISALSII